MRENSLGLLLEYRAEGKKPGSGRTKVGGLESERVWGLLFGTNRREMPGPRFQNVDVADKPTSPNSGPSEAYLVSELF